MVVGPYWCFEPVGDLGVDSIRERNVLVHVAEHALDCPSVVFLGGNDEHRGTNQLSQKGTGACESEPVQYQGVRLLQRGICDDRLEVLFFEPVLLFEKPCVQGVGRIGPGVQWPRISQDGAPQEASP